MSEGAPRLGIEDALPAADYHAIDSCSASRLRDLALRSPAYCRHRIDHPEPHGESDAKLRGTVTHAAILEPETLETRFLVAGQCEATTGKGERCKSQGSIYRAGAWWCGIRSHAPPPLPDEPPETRVAVPQAIMDEGFAIRDAVYGHPAAAALLRREVRRECSVFWQDTTWGTGLACKGRPDIYAGDIVGDVKVCRQASPSKFDAHVAGSMLHVQCAFYLAGLREVGREPGDFLWVAVEPDAPFEVCVYVAEPEVLRCGNEEVRKAIERYAECVRTGVWPAYASAPLPLALPFWSVRASFPEEFL